MFHTKLLGKNDNLWFYSGYVSNIFWQFIYWDHFNGNYSTHDIGAVVFKVGSLNNSKYDYVGHGFLFLCDRSRC